MMMHSSTARVRSLLRSVVNQTSSGTFCAEAEPMPQRVNRTSAVVCPLEVPNVSSLRKTSSDGVPTARPIPTNLTSSVHTGAMQNQNCDRFECGRSSFA